MSGTVLMFGNHHQGDLMEIHDPGQPIRVMTPPRMSWLREDDEPDSGLMVPRETLYEPRRMEIFGIVLRVHVERNLPEERLEALLADHLLSDKARAVMEDRWTR